MWYKYFTLFTIKYYSVLFVLLLNSLNRPNEEVPRICLWVFYSWTSVLNDLRLTSTSPSASATTNCTWLTNVQHLNRLCVGHTGKLTLSISLWISSVYNIKKQFNVHIAGFLRGVTFYKLRSYERKNDIWQSEQNDLRFEKDFIHPLKGAGCLWMLHQNWASWVLYKCPSIAMASTYCAVLLLFFKYLCCL